MARIGVGRPSLWVVSCLHIGFQIILIVLFLQGVFGQSEGHDDADNFEVDDNDYNNSSSYYAKRRDGWQADDLFFYWPTDDALLKELNAEIVEMRAHAELEAEREAKAFHITGTLHIALAAMCSLVGFITATSCISTALYCHKLDALMRRYRREGTVVEAKVLLSDPNMEELLEKVEDTESQKGLVHADSNLSEDNSYTMMTEEDDDGMSYQQMINGSDDDSGGSDSRRNDNNQHINNSDNTRRPDVESERTKKSIVQFTPDTTNYPRKTRPEKSHTRQSRGISRSQRFRAIVEYDDVTVGDRSRIRKQLELVGRDVTIAETQDDVVPTEFQVRLYVLPKHNLSGYPCEGVHRSLSLQRRVSIVIYIMCGLSVSAGGAFLTWYIIPTALFWAYISLMVLQVPILSIFLSEAFGKVIDSEYLQQGVRVSSEQAKMPFNALGSKESFDVA
jgi:hypothetical protein